MKKAITFESIPPAYVTARFVLSAFGCTTDKTGTIIRKKGRKPFPGLDGKPVKIGKFAGIIKTAKGPRLVTNNLVDLLQVADALE